MHKRRWNALKLEFVLEPRGPLLIKAGTVSPNPSLPDMQFVRTMTSAGEKVFLPGSSLKGVFRSFTEKVLRTARADEEGACDPFGETFCGRRLGEERDAARVYRDSCRACRLYGNTRLRGRLAFTDALPAGEVATEVRQGVALSRLTHAVAVGPFDLEVVVSGRFAGALVLENFEVWQLGLLALTLEALNDGLVRVGFGKNRGFGEVRLKPTRITVEMTKSRDLQPGPGEIWGVGAFMSPEEREAYGILLGQGDRFEGLPEAQETEDLGFYERRRYDPEQWPSMAERAVQSLPAALGREEEA